MIKTVRLSMIQFDNYEISVEVNNKIINGENFELLQETYGIEGSHDIGYFRIGEGEPLPDVVCTLDRNVQLAVMELETVSKE